MSKKRFLFLLQALFVFLFSFFFIFTNAAFSAGGLEEDLSNWSFTGDNWIFKDYESRRWLGLLINDYHTVEEAILKNLNQNNYVMSLEMVALRGADKNLLFRVKDSLNRHGVHIDSNRNIICFERWLDGNGWDQCIPWTFNNREIYQLTLGAYKGNFRLSINDNLVFDREEETYVKEGSIGLKVSTGAIAPSAVYFDNIKVTPILTPIIILPGHTGSINYSEMLLGIDNPDGWRMVPGVHVYDNLIASLEKAGYEQGENLFVFNYNWMQSIWQTADELHTFVQEVTADHISDEVQMIGHSMGGLLARTCAQKFTDNCLASDIVTVGSPHRGSLTAYGAYEAGEIWRDPWQRVLLSLFLKIRALPGETLRQTTQRIAPSTQDMLPDFAYLKNLDGQVITYNESNYPQSTLYPQISPITQLNDKINFVYGQGVDTLTSLKVNKELSWWEKALGNWRHGKVVEKEYTAEGDCAILTKSSAPEETIASRQFNFDHTGLVEEADGIAGIFDLLDIDAVPVAGDYSVPEDYLVFSLQSPAYLTMENIGGEVLFLPNGSKPKLAIIANPQLTPSSRLNVVGEDNGHYTLWTGRINSNGDSWHKTVGQIQSGQTHAYRINSTPTTASVQPVADTGGQQYLLDRLAQLLSGYPELEQKHALLVDLIDSNPIKAIEYAHQLRNYASLLYSQGDEIAIKEIIKVLNDIIALLQIGLTADVSPEQAQAGLTDSQQVMDGLRAYTWSQVSQKQNRVLSARLFKKADSRWQSAQGFLNNSQNLPAFLGFEDSYYWGKNSRIFLE